MAIHQDLYTDHRLALSIIDPTLSGIEVDRTLRSVNIRGAEAFASLLLWHKLAPIWDHIAGREQQEIVCASFWNILREERFRVAALYMAQKAALIEIDQLLEAAGIAYASIKGAHVREIAYTDPSLRPATDIDLLILPDQRLSAVSSLLNAGFQIVVEKDNISHEVTLSRGKVDIDLHWDILRPGRTRHPLAGALLDRRVRVGDIWGLDPSDSFFVTLIHPAFTKYVTSPNAALITVVDLVLLLALGQVDWNAVVARLDDIGLKTAAWTMLSRLVMLIRPGSAMVPNEVIEALQPKFGRRWYLRQWLDKDLATRWFDRPMLAQLGLTLALHDHPADAWRAMRGWMASRVANSSDPMLGNL